MSKPKPKIKQSRPEITEPARGSGGPAGHMDSPQHRPNEEEHGVRGADSNSEDAGEDKPGARVAKAAQRGKKESEHEWKIADGGKKKDVA